MQSICYTDVNQLVFLQNFRRLCLYLYVVLPRLLSDVTHLLYILDSIFGHKHGILVVSVRMISVLVSSTIGGLLVLASMILSRRTFENGKDEQ